MAKASMQHPPESLARKSIWGLLLIVVVIGGIYTGVSSLPTEAAAMSAVYAFVRGRCSSTRT